MLQVTSRLVGTAVAMFVYAGVACAAPPADGPSAWCAASPASANQPAGVKVLAWASQNLTAVPHAMPRLHTEGMLPHQGISDESVAAKRDFPLMRNAALAWRLTGDRRYAEQVDTFLFAWTTTYTPSFNPIDETDFDGLIDAYVLTRDALSPQTRDATKRFLRTLAEGYIARSETIRDSGNWQSHRVKLMAMSAAALEDRELLSKVHRLFLQQIGNNVQPDGSVWDFWDRDALHYVLYDLEPLVKAAIAAQPFEKGWLYEKAGSGVTLASAIDWLIPYANGERTHQEFVHSHAAFDKKRADAGVPGYSGEWDRKKARWLFWSATWLDGRYRPVAEGLGPAPEWFTLCAAQ